MQMFKTFLGFCVAINVQLHMINSAVLLAYLEFLKVNDFTFSAINNYLSAAKSMLLFYGWDTQMF